MGREEFFIWWLGILVGIVILATLFYWIIEDLDIDDEVGNKDLYNFIEKYFGKTFLKIFKIFI